MVNKTDGDMVTKGAALIGAVGTLLIALSIFLGWQTGGTTNTIDIRSIRNDVVEIKANAASKENVTNLSNNFHEFAVSVDSRLRAVEQAEYTQREQIINNQSMANDLKVRLDQIEAASRASLAPNRSRAN